MLPTDEPRPPTIGGARDVSSRVKLGRMTSVPERRDLPTDPALSYDYDSIAEGYTAENETSLVNAYYERPAMLDLAGDVTRSTDP